jgi:hypothetical protein
VSLRGCCGSTRLEKETEPWRPEEDGNGTSDLFAKKQLLSLSRAIAFGPEQKVGPLESAWECGLDPLKRVLWRDTELVVPVE